MDERYVGNDAAGVRPEAAPPRERSGFTEEEVEALRRLLPSPNESNGPPGLTRTTLNEDTFSFIITAPRTIENTEGLVRVYIPLLTAIAVLAIKVIIFSLVIDGTLKPTKGVDIPPGLDVPVTIGQFFAIGITFLFQDDIRSGMRLWSQGFGTKRTRRNCQENLIQDTFPESSKYGYFGASVLLLGMGILGLAATFLLIITTDDVVDLILNFTAITFVAELDNAAFTLARSGLIGERNRKEADKIAKEEYYAPEARQCHSTVQITMLYLLLACQFAVWAVIVHRQRAGWYLPKSIVVQFDDFVGAHHGTYSGIYIRRGKKPLDDGNRFVYQLTRGSRGKGTHPFFGYCSDQRVWTLFNNTKHKPCQDIIAKSSFSKSYDITDASLEQWYGGSDVFPGRYYPLEHFVLEAVCNSDEDCGGPNRGRCGGDRDKCICRPNFYGLRCDFQEDETCRELAVDRRFEVFRGSREFSETYHLVGEATTHIFSHAIYTSGTGGGLDLLVFTGLRWVIVHSHDAFPTTKNEAGQYFTPQLATQQDLQDHLKNHSFNPDVVKVVEFASEPVRFNSPSDLATPIDLQWFLPRRNERFDTLEIAGESRTRLLCGICSNETNPCFHGYTCTSHGTCECQNGASGKLCERTPPSVGDGQCDSFFNTDSFQLDGGDCCEHTCSGTGEHDCGIVAVGNDQVYRGFPHCITNSPISCANFSCWIPKARDLFLANPQQILLSPNGRILVVVRELEAGGEHLMLFDQVDALWVQRGPEITLSETNLRSSRIAVTTPSRYNLQRKAGKTPVTIAIAGTGGSDWGVSLYRWRTDDTDWHKLDPAFKIDYSAGEVNNLALAGGKDRVVVATKVVGVERTSVEVRAFQQNDLSELWDTTLEADHLLAFWLHSKGESMVLLQGSNDTLLVVVVSLKNQTICATDDAVPVSDTVPSDTVGMPNGTVPPCQPFPAQHTFPLNMSLSRMEDDWHICMHSLAASNNMTLITLASSRGVFLFQARLESTGEAAQQIVEPITFANMSKPQISLDCLSVGFYVETKLQVYRFDKRLGGWRVLGSMLNRTLPSEFSLSADGSVIAASDDSENSVSVLQVNSSICGEDENVLRLGIAPHSRPTETSWTVEAIQTVNGTVLPTTVVQDCATCYSEDDEGYFIEEVMCTRKSQLGCYQITFRGPEGVPFIATLASEERLELNDGSTPLPVITILEQAIDLCRQGEVKTCGEDQWLLALTITADEFGLRGWELQKENGSPVLSHPPNVTTPLGDTSLFQECIDAASGYQLVINNTEFAGNVSFRVFVDWEEQGPGADLVHVEVNQGRHDPQ